MLKVNKFSDSIKLIREKYKNFKPKKKLIPLSEGRYDNVFENGVNWLNSLEIFNNKEGSAMGIQYDDFDGKMIPAINNILKKIGREVDEEDVWTEAREYEDIPSFENVFYEIAFQEIEGFLSNYFGDNGSPLFTFEGNVNAAATSMSINAESFNDYESMIENLKEAVIDNIENDNIDWDKVQEFFDEFTNEDFNIEELKNSSDKGLSV